MRLRLATASDVMGNKIKEGEGEEIKARSTLYTPETLRGVKNRLFKQFTFNFWLWLLLLNHLRCPKLVLEFVNGPFQEIVCLSTAISTLQWRRRIVILVLLHF
jgi:hypothetical protein